MIRRMLRAFVTSLLLCVLFAALTLALVGLWVMCRQRGAPIELWWAALIAEATAFTCAAATLSDWVQS